MSLQNALFLTAEFSRSPPAECGVCYEPNKTGFIPCTTCENWICSSCSSCIVGKRCPFCRATLTYQYTKNAIQAAREGDVFTIRCIIRFGIEIIGPSVLEEAVQCGQSRMVRWLHWYFPSLRCNHGVELAMSKGFVRTACELVRCRMVRITPISLYASAISPSVMACIKQEFPHVASPTLLHEMVSQKMEWAFLYMWSGVGIISNPMKERLVKDAVRTGDTNWVLSVLARVRPKSLPQSCMSYIPSELPHETQVHMRYILNSCITGRIMRSPEKEENPMVSIS